MKGGPENETKGWDKLSKAKKKELRELYANVAATIGARMPNVAAILTASLKAEKDKNAIATMAAAL